MTETTCKEWLIFLRVWISFHSLATMYVLQTETAISLVAVTDVPPSFVVSCPGFGLSQSIRNRSTDIWDTNKWIISTILKKATSLKRTLANIKCQSLHLRRYTHCVKARASLAPASLCVFVVCVYIYVCVYNVYTRRLAHTSVWFSDTSFSAFASLLVCARGACEPSMVPTPKNTSSRVLCPRARTHPLISSHCHSRFNSFTIFTNPTHPPSPTPNLISG